jgi:hypothetical protein
MTITRTKTSVRSLSMSAIEDAWLRRATAVAIEQARAVVTGGAVPAMRTVGRLSDVEWGWVVSAVLFGWITTRAEQAINNGVGCENYIRTTGLDPEPWDVGAVASILPELVDCGINWNKPLAELSREEILGFLNAAFTLIRKAMAARDQGQGIVTRRSPASTARKTIAAEGGPLMTPSELDDPIPF